MSYEWIKEGGTYRVIDCTCGHKFVIGQIVKHVGVSNQFTDGFNYWYLTEDEVEEVPDPVLEVGKEYTSKNGYKWLCIATDGEYAHMRLSDTRTASAYCFNLDGTNFSQGGGDWDIAFPPREEWIDTRFSVGVRNTRAKDGVDNHVARIRFKLVDGKPDWSTATITE